MMYLGRNKKISVADSLDDDDDLEFNIEGDEDSCYEWLTKQDAEVLIEHLKNTFGI